MKFKNGPVPRVKEGGLPSNTAFVAIICCLGYTVWHTITYLVGLKLFNVFTPYFIIMYILEEIPNAYNLILCVAAIWDP